MASGKSVAYQKVLTILPVMLGALVYGASDTCEADLSTFAQALTIIERAGKAVPGMFAISLSLMKSMISSLI